MKSNTLVTVVVVLALAMVVSVGFLVFGNQQASITGTGSQDDGTPGPWVNALVPYRLIVKDEFTTANVDATIKVYKQRPADWGNPRGDFSKTTEYNTYTASSGVALIDEEKPGTYFAVMTETGYNTEFVTFTIPDGKGRADISVYSTSPDTMSARMSAVGTFVSNNITISGLSNATNVEIEEEISIRVGADTEFRGWKVIVEDQIGFTYDTNGNGIFDEGISRFSVNFQNKEYAIFDTSKSLDDFDSNDRYTFLIEGLSVADEERLYVGVEIKADTSTATGANDEKLGTGDGVIADIFIYDLEGTLVATIPVVV